MDERSVSPDGKMSLLTSSPTSNTKRRRVLVVLGSVVAAVLALLLIAFWPGPKEPEYQGKKLSEWVDKALTADLPRYGNPEVAEVAEARGAIRALGTNSLPYFVKWLHYERPRWREKISLAYEELPIQFRSESLAERIRGYDTSMQRARAYCGFLLLGVDAAPAIPALLRLISDRGDLTAIRCLGCIGPAAGPCLQELLESPKPRVRSEAFEALKKVRFPRPGASGTNRVSGDPHF